MKGGLVERNQGDIFLDNTLQAPKLNKSNFLLHFHLGKNCEKGSGNKHDQDLQSSSFTNNIKVCPSLHLKLNLCIHEYHVLSM